MFCMIGLPEFGVIVWIAVLLFGVKAVSQNPAISRGQKALWILTLIVFNWVGLLWYYYMFYVKDKEE